MKESRRMSQMIDNRLLSFVNDLWYSVSTQMGSSTHRYVAQLA